MKILDKIFLWENVDSNMDFDIKGVVAPPFTKHTGISLFLSEPTCFHNIAGFQIWKAEWDKSNNTLKMLCGCKNAARYQVSQPIHYLPFSLLFLVFSYS